MRGIIFVVDAATLSTASGEGIGITETAQYLHDMLLILQDRHTGAKSSKGPMELPVLIAANKLDLFTALPANLVKKSLEAEITNLRNTRSRGLLDSDIGIDDGNLDDRETLGGNGEGKFDFTLMEEYNVHIEVLGGNVVGSNGSDTKLWWQWIGRHL